MYIKIKYLMVISMVFILCSCKSIEMFLNPNNYIPRDSPREREYIYDTIRISNVNGEIFESAVTGIKTSKQLIFTNIGQSYSFPAGESIEIISEGIDFSNTTFDIETDELSKNIKLKLVDKDFSKVYLDSKCQTILRTGVEYVPKIELAKGLKPEQIVVTPVFDSDCNRIGFQIRYGSEESGCRSEAKDILSRFRDCTKNPSKKTVVKDKCKLKRKLGIPCN